MPAPIDLERLYDDHAQALFAFLLNFTRNEADTRDLLQDLLVSTLLWPSPQAWGALAAVWLAILAIQIASRGGAATGTNRVTRPAPAMVRAYQEQARLLAELIGQPQAPKPKQHAQPVAPLPRSERREQFSYA